MTGPRHADRPEHTLHPDQLEVAPGFQHEGLQGWIPELASEDDLREALEKAVNCPTHYPELVQLFRV